MRKKSVKLVLLILVLLDFDFFSSRPVEIKTL